MSDTIYIKSPKEIELMRQAGRITAGARSIARQAVAAGVTTKQINNYVHEFIVKSGAKPTFLNYGGFPGSACVSVKTANKYWLKNSSMIVITEENASAKRLPCFTPDFTRSYCIAPTFCPV